MSHLRMEYSQNQIMCFHRFKNYLKKNLKVKKKKLRRTFIFYFKAVLLKTIFYVFFS